METGCTPFNTQREVNVVKVAFDFTMGFANNLTYTNSYYQGDGKTQPDRAAIYSAAAADHAMQAAIVVDAITGPTVDGVQRGPRFIDTGFMQVARHVLKHADFNGARLRRISSLEGASPLLDVSEDGGPFWYDSKVGYKRGDDTDAPIASSILRIRDTPYVPASDILIDSYEEGGLTFLDYVDFFSITHAFDTYVAVHTLDSSNGSSNVYTIRDSAAWPFRASGFVSQNDSHTWSLDPVIDPMVGVNSGSNLFVEKSDAGFVSMDIINKAALGQNQNKANQGATWSSKAF